MLLLAVLILALEKLYDDYDLDEGDELLITKKKNLDTHTKIKLEKNSSKILKFSLCCHMKNKLII